MWVMKDQQGAGTCKERKCTMGYFDKFSADDDGKGDYKEKLVKAYATLGLPAGALVLLIRRGGGFIVPHGNTEIMVNDALMILGSPDILAKTGKVLGVPSEE